MFSVEQSLLKCLALTYRKMTSILFFMYERHRSVGLLIGPVYVIKWEYRPYFILIKHINIINKCRQYKITLCLLVSWLSWNIYTQLKWYRSWWKHNMETLSTLLVLCHWNPRVTGGFPSQGASSKNLLCFSCRIIAAKGRCIPSYV